MQGPLYLSSLDSNPLISVQPNITDQLTFYQINGARFLYQQCFIKNQNVVLNNEEGMNEARQLSALFSAVTKPYPSLIICHSSKFIQWYYEFSNVNLKILTPNELINQDSSSDDEFNSPDAVIITHDQLKHVKVLPITEWYFVIVDDIDLVIKSRFLKNIPSKFRIALTSHNFLINDSTELQWRIMKWVDVDLPDTIEDFARSDKYNKEHLLSPFPDYWDRLTWVTLEEFKPTDTEKLDYEKLLKIWAKNMNVKVPEAKGNRNPAEKTKQRKSNQTINKIKSIRKKKRQVANKKRSIPIAKFNSSDEESNEAIITFGKTNNNYISDKKSIGTDSADDDGKNVIRDSLLLFDSDKKNPPLNNNEYDMSENRNFVANKTVESVKKSLSTEMKRDSLSESENEILNFLFDLKPKKKLKTALNGCSSSSQTVVHVQNHSTTKSKSSCSKIKPNFILDSLFENSTPICQKKRTSINAKDESCPILDMLL